MALLQKSVLLTDFTSLLGDASELAVSAPADVPP